MSKPRVTASYIIQPVAVRTFASQDEDTSPGVELVVEFDLGDQAAAVQALEVATDAVRAQIERAGKS